MDSKFLVWKENDWVVMSFVIVDEFLIDELQEIV